MRQDLTASVVVPAYNSAKTIRRTLESLIAQTFQNWEAIVVDDGSTDESVAIASEVAAGDPRISVVREPHRGASHTRNAGFARARNPWLYFLDSDDWIHPRALERLIGALAANPDLDAVTCGWALVANDGTVIEEGSCAVTGDLFPVLARRSAFIIHACVVAREFVERAGGFDPALRITEDWAMWQRIARLGARFGRVPETLAYYLQREGSLSADPVSLFDAALSTIELGHGPDARISRGPHVSGEPPENLPGAKLNYLCWVAGMMIARGFDPAPLLSRIEPGFPHLQPDDAGESIYRAVPAALAARRSVWSDEWSRLEPVVARFLNALERHMAAPGHARSTMHAVARRVLDARVSEAASASVVSVGDVGAVSIDVSAPIADMRTELKRVRAHVHVQGDAVGVLELPVIDGLLRAAVLRDAIADRFAWLLLQKSFQRQIYSVCEFRVEGQSCSAWYRGSCIARDLPLEPEARVATLHDIAGWRLFLGELWNWQSKNWLQRVIRCRRKPPPDPVFVETSEPCPHLPRGQEAITLVLTVGGSPLGAFLVPLSQGGLPATALRQTLTDAAGFELCRVAVREALVGHSWDDGRSLRERLSAQNARRKLATPGQLRAQNEKRLLPEWQRSALELAGKNPLLLIGRRSGPIGSSAARTFAVPESIRESLLEVEQHNATPIVRANTDQFAPVLYAPALLARPGRVRVSDEAGQNGATLSVRHDFESLFARGANPWHYDSAYEQCKYEQTLSLLPQRRIERALELACAEGHFTRQLAPRVHHLLATDISEIALGRAVQKCDGLRNVEFRTLDLANDAMPVGFDLIVGSEVLYYMGDVEVLRATAKKIAGALAPGGVFITAHARVVSDEPDRTGYAWDVPFGAQTMIDVFSNTAPLRLIRELRTPLYRIALFKAGTTNQSPEVETVGFELPVPEMAAHIVWSNAPRPSGSVARKPGSSAVPTRLPILMYHHVAPDGAAERKRLRVHPEAFEQQLRYLRECGFTSMTLEDWRDVVEGRNKQPVRPVLLTFDDAYVDFAERAWPLLRRYGFSASLFVVTGSVGGRNTWDSGNADERLLDWSALRQLRDGGLAIGSHSVTHARLTGLSSGDIAREAVESRLTLERELDISVRTFAYPWGDEGEVVQHMTAAAGYLHGLSCRPGPATRRDSWLALPRIEVTGFDDLPSFIAKLA